MSLCFVKNLADFQGTLSWLAVISLFLSSEKVPLRLPHPIFIQIINELHFQYLAHYWEVAAFWPCFWLVKMPAWPRLVKDRFPLFTQECLQSSFRGLENQKEGKERPSHSSVIRPAAWSCLFLEGLFQQVQQTEQIQANQQPYTQLRTSIQNTPLSLYNLSLSFTYTPH